MDSRKLTLKKRIGLELFRQIRHDANKIHTLRTLFWECTLKCNMNCRHCGSDCRQLSTMEDMPLEDFLKVIDGILPHVDPHKTFITLTGGEALMRPDIEQCGRELNKREFPWGLVTNGYLLTQERLHSLIEAGLHSVAVSMDGFEEEHNWIRQHPHSFQKASQAIRNLAQRNEIVWDVVTCVNPRNIHQLEDFKKYLISLGVRYWRVFTIFPMGRAALNPHLQLSHQQFRQVFQFIERTRKEGRIHVNYGCEGFLGGYEGEVRDQYFHCRAGVEVASVLCDGSISGCTSIRSNFHQGNIYQDDFWEVWQNQFQLYRNRQWARKGECSSCKMWRYCEGSGMHLYDNEANLLFCHYHRMNKTDHSEE